MSWTLNDKRAEALENLISLDSSVWFDLAEKLTCTEAEEFAGFLAAFDIADRGEFLAAHAVTDDEGDTHGVTLTGELFYREPETQEEGA